MEGMDKMTDLERLTSNIWSSRDFGGWDPDDGFEGVLDALPLRYFRCREILSPHRKQIARELGYGERFDVPEAMWRNGITILLIADKIRHAVGHPVQMRNFYRPADYNKAVGGSENSDHIEARAVDLDFATAADRMFAQGFVRGLADAFPSSGWGLGIGMRSLHVGIGRTRGSGRIWYYDSFPSSERKRGALWVK